MMRRFTKFGGHFRVMHCRVKAQFRTTIESRFCYQSESKELGQWDKGLTNGE